MTTAVNRGGVGSESVKADATRRRRAHPCSQQSTGSMAERKERQLEVRISLKRLSTHVETAERAKRGKGQLAFATRLHGRKALTLLP